MHWSSSYYRSIPELNKKFLKISLKNFKKTYRARIKFLVSLKHSFLQMTNNHAMAFQLNCHMIYVLSTINQFILLFPGWLQTQLPSLRFLHLQGTALKRQASDQHPARKQKEFLSEDCIP